MMDLAGTTTIQRTESARSTSPLLEVALSTLVGLIVVLLISWLTHFLNPRAIPADCCAERELVGTLVAPQSLEGPPAPLPGFGA